MKILAWMLFISALADTILPLFKIAKLNRIIGLELSFIIKDLAKTGTLFSLGLNILAAIFFAIYLF